MDLKNIAEGVTEDGTTWTLHVAGDSSNLASMVRFTRSDGSKGGFGIGGGPATRGRSMNSFAGSSDSGPREFLARVPPNVRAVVVTLSDGSREDLVLYGDPDLWGCKFAVLLYRRELDIHRVDLIDLRGQHLITAAD